MTVEQGLAFLNAYQPMPDDTELSEELVRAYDEVRRFFIEHPDARCIPLFLKSFGAGDGFGVYQLVEDVLRHFRHRYSCSLPQTGVDKFAAVYSLLECRHRCELSDF